MRKIGGGLATLESEGCLSVVGFCIKHEVAPRNPERVVKRVGAARCCVKRLVELQGVVVSAYSAPEHSGVRRSFWLLTVKAATVRESCGLGMSGLTMPLSGTAVRYLSPGRTDESLFNFVGLHVS